jgi:hypothetical protein
MKRGQQALLSVPEVKTRTTSGSQPLVVYRNLEYRQQV